MVEVGLPTRAQAALISPSAPACVAQDRLEWALVRAIGRMGVGEVMFGAELTRFTVCADGVRATVRTADGTREVRARHLIAADGARSAVREALGIPMHGADDLLGAVTALFRAPLWDVVGDRRYGIYGTMAPGAEGTFLPWAPGDRWGFGLLVDVSNGAPPMPSADELLMRLRRAAGVPGLPVELERVGWFSSAAKVAERFREGPVFLTGDAAHRVTPRGGTGMNTAFHDGHDLGRRLAWVHRGWAAPALLDGYEAERRPVAEHNVARSADPDGSPRPAGEELRVDLGGRIAHHWLPGGRSTLDLARAGAHPGHRPGRRAVARGRRGARRPDPRRGGAGGRVHRPRPRDPPGRGDPRPAGRGAGGDVVVPRRRRPRGRRRGGDRAAAPPPSTVSPAPVVPA